MKIIWTKEALQDRTDIWEYLSERNPVAAVELDERFSAIVGSLAEHPLLGKAGEIAGTRELIPHDHYRVIYEGGEESGTVWIVALIHTARCWPPLIHD